MKLFTIEETADLLANDNFCEDGLKAEMRELDIPEIDFESMKAEVLRKLRRIYIESLLDAIESKKLRVINPRTGLSYSPDVVREFYDQINLDDLIEYFQSQGLDIRHIQ